jgi:hypothetical protein
MCDREAKSYIVLGQKYAYATVSLVLGITSFMNIIGMEKAVLAIVFAWMALKPAPEPALKDRRAWAKTGLALGAIVLIAIPTIIILNFERLREIIEALEKLSTGR